MISDAALREEPRNCSSRHMDGSVSVMRRFRLQMDAMWKVWKEGRKSRALLEYAVFGMFWFFFSPLQKVTVFTESKLLQSSGLLFVSAWRIV